MGSPRCWSARSATTSRRRGFAAVETYPEVGAKPNATSAAQPAFWERLGFVVAAPDDRFPVMRRELA